MATTLGGRQPGLLRILLWAVRGVPGDRRTRRCTREKSRVPGLFRESLRQEVAKSVKLVKN